jgi:amino acid adenylation domain-containing protein
MSNLDQDAARPQLDDLQTLGLPTDRTRRPDAPNRTASRRAELPAELIAGLRELGPLPTTMLAVLQVLLGRYADTEDVAVAVPGDVVRRGDLSGQPGFRDLLRRAQVTGSPAPAGGARTRTPVFFAADGSGPEPGFDVALGVRPDDGALTVAFDANLFEEATIDRMLGHYRTLLEAVVREPDRAITTLPMLTGGEWQDVVAWNDTAREFPEDLCLHQLFESHAADGDAPAVICGADVLTRAELEAFANRLAHRLVEQGIGPESLVGICLRRSPELVVAILGVLKAGAAYLPLDPDYPPQRLRLMLDDSRCAAVISEEALRPGLGDVGAPVLCLDSEDLGSHPASRPDVAVGPENLAYVIYTSGSTGDPKGIALRHRGAVNNFTDFNSRFAIGPGDRVLSVSSPSFDMSVYDILGMLGAGGTVVLPEPELVRDPPGWARLLRQHRVTVWHSAPALLDLLLEYVELDPSAAPEHLRLALLGGDWIPVTMPDRLRQVAPAAQFISLGGATEASMDSTIFPVERVDPAWTSIPYGRPMANQRVYVLDQHRNPVPVGLPGELYLAGTGLARGYLNRPALTAERFVTHTFPGDRTERLYRTGDMARYRPDGVLELLGRRDFQVKIHGLRIELGEIEAVLRRHPDVANAVVVASGARGDTRLAGFVTLNSPGGADTAGVSAKELRRWLGELLPAHMVPRTITMLDRLPTTPNGKVDRQALTARGPR